HIRVNAHTYTIMGKTNIFKHALHSPVTQISRTYLTTSKHSTLTTIFHKHSSSHTTLFTSINIHQNLLQIQYPIIHNSEHKKPALSLTVKL
ncbi:hypothetical protein VIGAN_02123000, partial [Vigna angularis var. angularis]